MPSRHLLSSSINSPNLCAMYCCAFQIRHIPTRLTVQATTRIQQSLGLSICPRRFLTTSACPTGRQRLLWAFSTMSAPSRSVVQCLRCNVEQGQPWLAHCVSLRSIATQMRLKKSVHHHSSPRQRSPQPVSCRSLPTMRMQLSATTCGVFQLPSLH